MRKQVVILVVSLIALFSLSLDALAGDPPTNANTASLPSEQALNADWPMAAANPERTSWTPEEVRGYLKPLWFKPFEPYISQKVQIIAANDMLYISTARGLYALDAETGAERWVYPTELPLGHSPTITNNVAYVGGFDRKIHAINALTGAGLWTFEAKAGFQTNPLVVGDKVFAGNRDGYFYAIYAEGHPQAGQLAWPKYKTQGPILFSAAYKDGVVFFASNDNHAYALNAETGALVWKSDKLPGAGFHSWWPVVYKDRVIFVGSNNYRMIKPGFTEQLTAIEKQDVYPNYQDDPRGTLVGLSGQEPGDWASGTQTIDMSKPNVTGNGSTTAVTQYFEGKPWRRTYFVLEKTTGQETTYDFDSDGNPEYAPILWVGTHSGNRYPPIVGGDGVIYQSNNFKSDPWIAGGHISGWKMDTPFISVPNNGWNAVDEPQAYSAGGNLIYWNRCCDRVGQAFDITQPGTSWSYFSYDLDSRLLGYNVRYHMSDTNVYASFDGPNGIYGYHGDTNPPIPYKGKVYMHRSNAVIAFADHSGAPAALPMAATVAAPNPDITTLGSGYLKAQLEQEIQNILAAGHLRPGYASHGIFGLRGRADCGDEMIDYWHNSAETIYTLLYAWPYLSPSLQQQVQTYLQNELATYPPYQYNHIGWRDGASREIFDLPDDVETDLVNYPPQQENYTFKSNNGWGRNPYAFYALWKYAQKFGGAKTIFDSSKNRLETPPADSVLEEKPFMINAYIAGYLGYLELEKLAGYAESTNIKTELDRLLALRVSTFSKDSPYGNDGQGSIRRAYCRTLNISRNFIFLVPELAQYLRANALNKVQQALDEYYELAPYWFVTFSEEGFAENAINPLYDAHSLFMAKALILNDTNKELEKYLDVPGFAKGDLFYIQKLVATLETSGFTLSVTPSSHFIESGSVATYTVQIQHSDSFADPVTLMATNPSSNLNLNLVSTTIFSPGGESALILTDLHPSSFLTGVQYTIPITATGGNYTETAKVTLLVNGSYVYIPIVIKH